MGYFDAETILHTLRLQSESPALIVLSGEQRVNKLDDATSFNITVQ